jgi:hypothetical protein
MQPLTDLHRQKAGKILIFFGGVVALVLTYYLSEVYLEALFSYDGEVYRKGHGHLLREDFWKALLFITTRQLLASTILSFLWFSVFSPESRRQLFRGLSFMALAAVITVLGYAVYQVMNISSEGYDRKDRVIEITLTWWLRVTGFYTGYRIANTVFRY